MVEPINFIVNSPRKIYGLPVDQNPQSFEIDSWKVTELYERGKYSPKENLGYYSLEFCYSISDKKELWSKKDELVKIISQLDRIWYYITTSPLNFHYTHVFLGHQNYLHDIRKFPKNWISNLEKVEFHLSRPNPGQLYARVSEIETQDWVHLDSFPLEEACRVRKEYLQAKAELKTLIDLHFSALTVEYTQARYFYFGKCLEILKVMLPGKTLKEKTALLPSEVLENLGSKSISKLFEIANSKKETRHVIKKIDPVELHPQMNDEEHKIFEHDVNCLIQSLVCEKMNIPKWAVPEEYE